MLAVRKVDQLDITAKMFDFETRVLIGWLERVFRPIIGTLSIVARRKLITTIYTKFYPGVEDKLVTA